MISTYFGARMNWIFEWFMNNPWATALLMVVFIAISTLMVLAILIQRPQGGGLSAAFGGGSAGSGQTAFGTKTGDALTWFTISVFTAFILFGILLNYATTPAAITAAPAAATSGASPEQPTGTDAQPAGTSAPVTPPADQPASPAEDAPNTTAPVTTPAPATPAPVPAPAEPAPKN